MVKISIKKDKKTKTKTKAKPRQKQKQKQSQKVIVNIPGYVKTFVPLQASENCEAPMRPLYVRFKFQIGLVI